jgi:hypothetical protein
MTVAPELDGLNFGVEKSLRYHQRRRAHYERLHKATMLGVILSGSAAFANSLDHLHWFGLVAATLGALDLVFGFSHRARDHELLHKRFTALAAELRTTTSPTQEEAQRWERCRLEIESDEPPTYWALEASCWNEVAHAWGRPASARLTCGQHLLMNWSTFDKAAFPMLQSPAKAEAESSLMCTHHPVAEPREAHAIDGAAVR